MKSLRAIILISIILLSTPWVSNLLVVHGQTTDVNYLLKSTVRYSNPSQNNVWNLTERGEYDRTINLFMNGTWQMAELVNSTFPVEVTKNDEDGNPVAVLSFPKLILNPGENLSLTVWYHIISKPRTMPDITETASRSLADIPQNLVAEYTREEGSWQTDSQQLISLAYSLKGNETNVLRIVKNFIEWMKDPQHITYPKDRHENPYYPNQTYILKEGDCDDQAILLGTLCRIVGIPSYLQIGSIYMPNHFGNISVWNGCASFVERGVGWHGWAFVYIPPWGWLPVDLTYVPEGFSDPLNAVKYGAVTLQNTTLFMNIIFTDYVGRSLEDCRFLESNGFQVYEEDEMMQEVKHSDTIPTTSGINPLVPIALGVLTVFAVFSFILVFRRSGNRKLERTLSQPSSARYITYFGNLLAYSSSMIILD